MKREDAIKIERRRAKLLRKIYSGEPVWEVYTSDKEASLDDVKGDLRYLLAYGGLKEGQITKVLEDVKRHMSDRKKERDDDER